MEPSKYGPFPYIPINRRPKITWPNGARVAVWVGPNIEAFALNEQMPAGRGKIPDVMNWSLRDYGARIGVYRIMDVLAKRDIRASVLLNSDVCDTYPEIIEDAAKLGWEFLGHNETNTQILCDIDPADEERLIHDCLARIEQATGRKPRGWLGSGVQETWNTLDFLAAEGLDYVCDWVNDDQPYMMDIGGKPLVYLPYSFDTNDSPAIGRNRYTPGEFERMIKDQFDVLYREGAESGRVMAICLHPYIIGQPHRIGALDRALEHICSHAGVWKATGTEIVEHYLKAGVTW